MVGGLNNPLPSDLGSECKKAAKILNSFIQNPNNPLDKVIPPDVLYNAKGFAIFTVVKAGFLFSARGGAGLVIARTEEGGWSAPSAIGTGGMGFGGQIGGEITDFVIILNNRAAVKSFMSAGSITLGGNLSVAAGPLGRNAEGSGSLNTKGKVAAMFSYSKTKGLFAGVSIEGSVIAERKDANTKFYGRPISAKELLGGQIAPPPQADVLIRALNAHAKSRFSGPSEFEGYAPSDGGDRSPFEEPASPSYQSPTYGGSNISSVYSPTSAKPKPPIPSLASKPSTNRSSVSADPKAIALYDFAGEQDGDLPFKKGDVIVITKKTDSSNDWWTGRHNGQEGIFPANYVETV